MFRNGGRRISGRCLGNKDVNVVTIVAWAGVGKSTLINHWLRRMAADHYRSAEFILVGPSTGRAPVAVLLQRMNSSTPLSLGSAIQIHGSEQHGRRARDSPSSSYIVEPYWFWTVWSRSKIRLVETKFRSNISRFISAAVAVIQSRRFPAPI